jgi:hypothetical protein
LPFSLLSLALMAGLLWLLRGPFSSRTHLPSRQLNSSIA